MTAIYRWEGAMQREAEVPMLLKTSLAGADRLRDWIVSHHPYDTPCVVALPVHCASSNADFLRWILGELAL